MTGMLVSVDQLTKFLVTNRFRRGETLSIFDDFLNLTLVYNPGAAFGLFASLPVEAREPLFFLVPGLTLVFILLVFSRLAENQQLSIYSLSMIVGGALGNIMDRLRLGHVIDFLDLHWQNTMHFPAFNVADAAISVGVALLFVSLVYEKESREA